jgi:phosphohistidine phosphatase
MELILWRHAEAEDTSPDMQRKLTDKGRLQAVHMADWLKQRLPKKTRILVSPALRTQQTALALSNEFITVDALAPGADVKAVLEAAQWGTSDDAVLIVGHQPTLGAVAARLLGHAHDSWSVKKGAVWWLASRDRHSDEQAVLKVSITPEML